MSHDYFGDIMDIPFWLPLLFMAIGFGARIGARRFVKRPADRSDFILASDGIIVLAGIVAFMRSWQVNGVIITIGAVVLGAVVAIVAPKLLLKWRSWRSSKRTVSLDK